MQTTERTFYPSLTGIRAIAAWLVFLSHFNFFKPAIFGTPIYSFFNEMHIGVTLFFVLSGLLITLRYYDSNINTKQRFYNYIVKRFARIYPIFFLILLLNFIWQLIKNDCNLSCLESTKLFLATAVLLKGFFANLPHCLMPQSWSLTTEECFYLSCPFIFICIKKSTKNIVWLPIGFVAAGICLTYLFSSISTFGFFKDFRFLFNFTFFGRCIEFFVGIAVALLFKKNKPIIKNKFIFTGLGITVIFICGCVLAQLSTVVYSGDHHPFGIITNNILLPVFGIAVLFWGLLTENNFITKILSSSPMILLGKSSYIFYLIHLGIFMNIFAQYISGNPLLVFIYLNVISIILYKFVEHPLNKFIIKKLIKV